MENIWCMDLEYIALSTNGEIEQLFRNSWEICKKVRRPMFKNIFGDMEERSVTYDLKKMCTISET